MHGLREMSMDITTTRSDSEDALTIKVCGRFDFNAHSSFREAYESASPTPARFVIDLSEAEYLDSSALGMLLLLRDHAGSDAANISLVNCNQNVRKILSIASFEQLFDIH